MYLGISDASALVGTGAACGGQTGTKTLAQLQCDMWLVALSDQGYHADLLPILTGLLTRLLEFCDGFRG